MIRPGFEAYGHPQRDVRMLVCLILFQWHANLINPSWNKQKPDANTTSRKETEC